MPRYTPGIRRALGLAGLGDLPEDYRRVGRMIDPTAGLALDWSNQYKTLQFGFQVGPAGTTLLQGNGLRTYLFIQNQDAVADLFIGIGTDPGGINGALIIPRGFAEFIGGEMGGAFCPPETINAVAAVNVRVAVIEGSLTPYEMTE